MCELNVQEQMQLQLHLFLNIKFKMLQNITDVNINQQRSFLLFKVLMNKQIRILWCFLSLQPSLKEVVIITAGTSKAAFPGDRQIGIKIDKHSGQVFFCYISNSATPINVLAMPNTLKINVFMQYPRIFTIQYTGI